MTGLSKKAWFIGLASGVVLLILLITWAVVFSALAVSAAKKHSFTNASTYAQKAVPAWSILSATTLRQIPDVEVARLGTTLLSDSSELLIALENVSDQLSTNTLDLSPFSNYLRSHQSTLSELATKLPQTKLFSRTFKKEQLKELQALLAALPDVTETLTILTSGIHRYIVVLQNSDELRATGGFMGSYAFIELQNGVLTTFIIEDIYDADGQFKGYVPAPPGVKEYLSSNNGLRLPDANWDPHFLKSAQQILQFFALGSRQDIDGIIAINNRFFASLLELTGPILLPDYQTSVTSENLTTVLRAEREDFFAGSIQKKHLLSQFKNQLATQLANTPPNISQAITLLRQNIQEKNILAFSHTPKLQDIIQKYQFDGSLFTSDLPGLALIESNVGINKANKGVTREIQLTRKDLTLTAAITFTNANKPPLTTDLQAFVKPDYIKTASNSATHLAYVNYQRAIYPKEWKLTSIQIGQTNLQNWDEEPYVLALAKEHNFTQVGFLVPVREKTTETVTFTFELPSGQSLTQLELYRQPGILSPNVTVSSGTTNNAFLLESNHATMLP